MHLAHTQPCPFCPWRRASAEGWLGASTPEAFVQAVLGEAQMPCHTAVDYERADWRAQVERAPLCAGALTFMRNIAKLPRDPLLASAIKQIEPDRGAVFARPQEFLDHHTLPGAGLRQTELT